MGGTFSAAAEPRVERRSYRWVAVPLLAFAVFSLTAGLPGHHEPRSKGYHCIFKLGFREPSTRVVVHGLLGCAVYGAFAANVTIVRLRRFPSPVPNLDGLRPTYAHVRTKVQRGDGGMPSFAGRLTAKQIRDVAAFVATSAGC